MRKFKIELISDGAPSSVEQEADGFHYEPDKGFFSQHGTATFYVRVVPADTYGSTDNIAIYRGVTKVTEVKPSGDGV